VPPVVEEVPRPGCREVLNPVDLFSTGALAAVEVLLVHMAATVAVTGVGWVAGDFLRVEDTAQGQVCGLLFRQPNEEIPEERVLGVYPHGGAVVLVYQRGDGGVTEVVASY